MASAIATANPDPDPAASPDVTQGVAPAKPARRWRWRWPVGSRLGRLIITLNLVGLAILVGGALLLNELRQGLVNARIDSLTTQGVLIGKVIDGAATVGEPEPAMEVDRAVQIIQLLFIPHSQRVRLFDAQGRLLADSYVVADRVEWKLLPPAKPRDGQGFSFSMGDDDDKPKGKVAEKARADLEAEVHGAMLGQKVAGMRTTETGERVVSVSIPIQRVQAVLGVLTLEASDVDEIISAERKALIPFILIAIGVTLISSFLLTRLIAQPILRLASAADRVRLSRARAIHLPDLARRDDEIGDLTRSLETMTGALSERMDAIERFAADVAHEIKNPLTSISSALETLDLVGDGKPRERLTGIIKQDVRRMDRLVTDISNASRLDAELSRDAPHPLDLGRLIADIAALYASPGRQGAAPVVLEHPPTVPLMVSGRDGPLGQVFRNLIDNARSFSPEGGSVRVSVEAVKDQVVVTVDDDGPGIPPENLETVFQRFYTSRPKGAAFGGNSGLGLSIARQIVEAHGGVIRAENRPPSPSATGGDGGGARFIVSLPEVTG
jgi:two-component system sensor histidine kinase ChvG